MAWNLLPVDYTDAAWVGLKRYNQIDNEDGTISLQDVTVYSNKEKSFFGAKDANRMNEALNTLMSMVENGIDLYTEFQNYFANQKDLFEAAANVSQEDFNAYIESLKADADTTIESIKTDYAADMETFQNQQEELFNLWFDYVKGQLGQDVAGNLLNEIIAVKETSDAAKAITDTKGQANGLATLDDTGKLAQMPNLADVGGSNENLLDNWYFADPIDQRQGYVVPKRTTYHKVDGFVNMGAIPETVKVDYIDESGSARFVYDGVDCFVPNGGGYVRGYTGSGYTIDRWALDVDAGGGITITDNGILITSAGSYWGTRLDNIARLAGMTVTGSALMSDDTLYSGTIDAVNWQLNIPQNIFSSADITCYINKIGDDFAQVEISSNRAGVGIKAVKLELGTQQTLAHQDANGNWVLNDPPPDKNMELLKCCMSTADSGDTYANKVIYHTGNITAGTADITANSTALAEGYIYQVYE